MTAGARRKELANMTARDGMLLNGLRQDSLAAVLALVGLLRALEESVPEWMPEAWWDRGQARLSTTASSGPSQNGVAEAAAKGVLSLGGGMLLEKKDIHDLEPAALPEMLSKTNADVVAALTSDGATNKRGHMRPTALCLMYGAGHQHFGNAFDAAFTLQEEKMAGEIRKGLFDAWDRAEEGSQSKAYLKPFRLDWRENRRHALRARDPVGFKAPVTGAEPLTALGIVEFTSAPEHGGQLGTTGFSRSGTTVAWPVWDVPLPLAAVRVLLRMEDVRRIAELQDQIHKDGQARIQRAGKGGGRAGGMITRSVESMQKYNVQVMVAKIFRDGQFNTAGIGRPI